MYVLIEESSTKSTYVTIKPISIEKTRLNIYWSTFHNGNVSTSFKPSVQAQSLCINFNLICIKIWFVKVVKPNPLFLIDTDLI